METRLLPANAGIELAMATIALTRANGGDIVPLLGDGLRAIGTTCE
jgi:hypothetical protein